MPVTRNLADAIIRQQRQLISTSGSVTQNSGDTIDGDDNINGIISQFATFCHT